MTINEHIRNIYREAEVDKISTLRKSLIVQMEGKRLVIRVEQLQAILKLLKPLSYE